MKQFVLAAILMGVASSASAGGCGNDIFTKEHWKCVANQLKETVTK